MAAPAICPSYQPFFISAVGTNQVSYQLTIDGQSYEATCVALTVTNSGSMGIGGLQHYPGISISDGLLDVVLLKDTGDENIFLP